jgi:UDP-N-acetylglucosamine acyltransferase
MVDLRPARVHSTAVVSAQAELAADVEVGAHCVIEGPVRLGAGCRIEDGAFLFGPLVMGRNNYVYARAVLGEKAQHLRGGPALGVEVGHANFFRAGVTIHQGRSEPTRIGDGNRFFADSHVAHDCQVGDRCVLAAGALLAGHCQLADGVRLGRRCGVHQFCRMGRLARLLANGVTTKDVPPFIVQRSHNTVAGVNARGMLRSGLSAAHVETVERLYEILYRQGMTVPAALLEIETTLGSVDIIEEFLNFVRNPGRGINLNTPASASS